MAKLYILGGRQRRAGLSEPTDKDEWYLYDTALIVEVDTDTREVCTRVEYQSPPEARAGNHPSAHFHSGALVGDILYTCTTTEVLVYRVPQFELLAYVSLPCFNDVHHATPSSDGNLLVVSTGLEMVVKVSPCGKVLQEWNVLGEPAWGKFSPATDYRKVETTKPHRSHPNFTFELDGEVWATRFHQKDAISLNGSKRRIELGGEFPHDGLISGDRILFTAVDGKVVIVNRHTLQVEKSVDLREIQDREHKVLPAWCRGLLPVNERNIWVGFSRIRKTMFRENVRWVKNVLGESTVKPTHIALFDLVDRKCLQEIDLEPHGMNTVFGILPAGN